MVRQLIALVVCISLIQIYAYAQNSPSPEVFCLDKFQDLSKGQWDHDSPYQTLHYAKTSQDFPDDLKGKLSGKDFFYFDGSDQKTFWFNSVENWDDGTPTPVYMYIKYYAHIGSEGGQEGLHVFPSWQPGAPTNLYDLAPTTNFEFREDLIELDVPGASSFLIYLTHFQPKDYFVMDTVILSKGHVISSVNDILNLCQEPTESLCQGDEFYADPDSCNKFHQCQYNEDGSVLDDSIFTCPATTVWCQSGRQCDYPTNCPCSN